MASSGLDGSGRAFYKFLGNGRYIEYLGRSVKAEQIQLKIFVAQSFE